MSVELVIALEREERTLIHQLRAVQQRLEVERAKVPPRAEPQQLHPCGTYGAYKRHKRRGEDPDEACKAAYREYQRRRRAGEPVEGPRSDLQARTVPVGTSTIPRPSERHQHPLTKDVITTSRRIA